MMHTLIDILAVVLDIAIIIGCTLSIALTVVERKKRSTDKKNADR